MTPRTKKYLFKAFILRTRTDQIVKVCRLVLDILVMEDTVNNNALSMISYYKCYCVDAISVKSVPYLLLCNLPVMTNDQYDLLER